MIFTISSCNLPEILFCSIAPSALAKSKGKFRRDIASSDHMTELLYNIIGTLPFNHIKLQVCIFAGYLHGIHSGIANVKGNRCRIVKKHSKGFFSGHNDKIMCTVQGMFILCMLRIIGTVTGVNESSLIDTAVGFSQSVDDILFIHDISKRKSIFCTDFSISWLSFCCLNVFCQCLSFKGLSIYIFFYHFSLSCYRFL